MRVLVLGCSGMLGHKVAQVLSRELDVFATSRSRLHEDILSVLGTTQVICPVCVEDLASIENAIQAVKPSVVINGIGVVKQLSTAGDPVTCITVNSLFPHQLEAICHKNGVRLICISTDCVFSGERGGYVETDRSDASDLYGRTKFLGEVAKEGTLTLRTSIIGRELVGTTGLVEWFLSQDGETVRGFRKAVFSGVTTHVLANILYQIIRDHQQLQGVFQIAADPITKYDLLALVRNVYGLDVTIEADDAFVCDRSLNGARFESATGIKVPSWCEMIQTMYDDPTPYDQVRRRTTGKT